MKVLFAGDALFTNFHPNMRDADVDGWVKTLDKIAALDVLKIIPGHGPVSSKQDVADMKQYLLIFDAKARELSAKSHDPAYIGYSGHVAHLFRACRPPTKARERWTGSLYS